MDVVVSYSFSTSNHNNKLTDNFQVQVVSYSFSTSNHNRSTRFKKRPLSCILFVFYIKPQPRPILTIFSSTLYLIRFLHQTTTVLLLCRNIYSCILFVFYIKPQLTSLNKHCDQVVSYSFSTSNHNLTLITRKNKKVVSYSFSTSNHNDMFTSFISNELYLIRFLHQTTTA